MTKKAMKTLTARSPERALLWRAMQTYLNHLAGSAERDEIGRDAKALEAEEAVVAARLAGLPPLFTSEDGLRSLSSSAVMTVCGPGSTGGKRSRP